MTWKPSGYGGYGCKLRVGRILVEPCEGNWDWDVTFYGANGGNGTGRTVIEANHDAR